MSTSPLSSETSDSDVRSALDRITGSKAFVMSDRLCRFLRFTVETALDGQSVMLKESLIGAKVYDRKPSYDPSQDSIVRTEARRLRAKLKEYYDTTGQDDPVRIEFPLGSYAPAFRSHKQEAARPTTPTDESLEPGPRVSVAMLPLVDMSGSAISSSLSRGLSEELTHALTHTAGLRIAAATAAQLGAQPSDIPTLAGKLGVNFLLEGSVREENRRVRVAIRLVAAKGFQIWSLAFDAEAPEDSLFQLAERIAAATVSRLRPEQSAVRISNALVDPSVAAALPAVYAGEAFLDSCTPADRQAAHGRFLEALKVAPRFARIYCGIAEGHTQAALSGTPDSAREVAAAREAAERALDLDPKMIAAQQSMACVLTLEGKWTEAEAGFLRARDLGDHAGRHREYGLFLSAQGRFDDAWHYLEKAQQIDPFAQRQKLACAKFFQLSGRLEEARRHFQDYRMFGPPPLAAELTLELAQAGAGNLEKVHALAQTARRQATGHAPTLATVAECLARAGDRETAVRMIDEHKLLDPGAPLSHFRKTLLAISLERPAEALDSLAESVGSREAELLWLQVDPRLAPLREEKTFATLFPRPAP